LSGIRASIVSLEGPAVGHRAVTVKFLQNRRNTKPVRTAHNLNISRKPYIRACRVMRDAWVIDFCARASVNCGHVDFIRPRQQATSVLNRRTLQLIRESALRWSGETLITRCVDTVRYVLLSAASFLHEGLAECGRGAMRRVSGAQRRRGVPNALFIEVKI
jgi:hypothetical protein